MPVIKFKSKIKIRGVNPYIPVSSVCAKKIKPAWKKPMPVLIRINGIPENPWRINMMPAGNGSFYLYLHGNVRKASGTKVGDSVDVEISFDSAYRNGPMHPMPVWFSTALKNNPAAKSAWKILTPSRQKEILRYFAALKSDEARKRNLSRAIKVLSGNKERFMARSWNEGK
ncbi:MAG: YdeI/OmpD-associated family protein [Ignavibacteria bacterium]